MEAQHRLMVDGLVNTKIQRFLYIIQQEADIGKKTTYVVDHAAAENGVVTFDSSIARAEDEIYTVMVTSDNYVDMTKNITLTGEPITVSNGLLLLGKRSNGRIYTDSGN